jgi:hypothetical protein
MKALVGGLGATRPEDHAFEAHLREFIVETSDA